MISEYSESAALPHDEAMDRKVLFDAVLDSVDHLGVRAADIIRTRFGLDGGGIRTQREIAKKYGVSVSRIGMIEREVFRCIRGNSAVKGIVRGLDGESVIERRENTFKRVMEIEKEREIEAARREEQLGRTEKLMGDVFQRQKVEDQKSRMMREDFSKWCSLYHPNVNASDDNCTKCQFYHHPLWCGNPKMTDDWISLQDFSPCELFTKKSTDFTDYGAGI